MKKNMIAYLILTCLFVSNISFGDTPKQYDVNISGIVKNITQHQEKYHSVTIIINDFIAEQPATYREKIKSDGSFHLQFPHYFLQNVTFKYGKRSILLLLQPGDNLNINYDAEEFIATKDGDSFKSIELAGDNIRVNRDLISFFPAFKKLRMSRGQEFYNKPKELSPNEYKDYLRKCMEEEFDLLEQFGNSRELSKEFKSWVEYDIKYSSAMFLLQYPMFHSRFNDKMISEIGLPNDYYKFFNEIKVECKKATITSAYFNFLHDYSNYLIMNLPIAKVVDLYTTEGQNISAKDKELLMSSRDKSHLTFTKKDIALLEKIGKENMELEEQVRLLDIERRLDYYFNVLEKGFVRDILLSRLFFTNLGSKKSYSFLKQHIEAYEKTVTDDLFKKRVREKFQETEIMLNDPLANNLYSSNNLKELYGDTLVSKILEKYKGKVLYVDFWAPWCGPCLGQLPYLTDLKHKFNNKVTFINFGCRTGELAWKAAIKKHNIKGENYLLDDNQYFQFKELFKINGIPHFVLIDKNGEIIDNNTMRPKEHDTVNGALVAKINELL